MKHLLEIASVLTKKKIAKIEILDDQVLKQKDSKFGKFYEGLLTGKIENDKDAALLLYGNADPGDAKYRQLKSRFKRRLLNTLFFLDINTPLASNYDQAHFNCCKELALAEVLLAYSANASAAAMYRQVLVIAQKFRFTELIIKAARGLREQAVLEEDEKSFKYHNELVQHHMPILKAEVQAEQYYLEAHEQYQRLTCHKECIQKLEELANNLVKLSEKPGSPKIHHYMFYVWVLYYDMIRDYEGVLEVCSNATQYVQEQKEFYSARDKTAYSIETLSAYFHLNDYAGGKSHAEENLTQLSENTPEWVDFMEYYLLLSLKADATINAIAIFNKVAGSAFFKILNEERREKWKLFEAALHYLIQKEGTNPLLLPRQRRKIFKLSDFINAPINYPPRLVALSLQQLAFQLLFLLQRKSYQGITERIEQLYQLANYELKKEGYERASAFVKLLTLLKKADFNLKDLKNTEKYLKVLQDHPFAYRGKARELEILPYEKLWHLILEHLE